MPLDFTGDVPVFAPGVTASDVPPRPKRGVRAVVCTNPFDPSERQIIDLKWSKKKTVAQYLWDLPEDVNWTLVATGRELPREEWASTTLTSTDSIVLIANPEKGVGRILASVAIVVVAAVLSYVTMGAATPLLGAAWGAAAGAAVGAVVSIAGSMLVNALMPADTGKTPGSKEQGDSSSYALDGPKPTAKEEAPLGVVYGTYRVGGNRMNYYAENSDDGKNQTLYLQYAVSEGEIDSISDLIINDRPLSDYTDISWDWRPGSLVQAPLNWFADTVTPVAVGTTITNTTDVLYTTSGEVDRVNFDISFPNGLYGTDKKTGDRYQVPIAFPASATNTVTGQVIPIAGALWRNDRTPTHYTIWSNPLPRGRYTLRIRRTVAESVVDTVIDKAVLAAVNEIQTDPIAYKRTAYYAVKVKLTEQFSQEPSTTVLVRGRKVNIYDANGAITDKRWSDNPADITLDMLLSTDWGSRLSPSRIDFPTFARWRTFCAANGLKFNGTFDYLTNLWDALISVCRVGRASPLVSGLKWSLAIEGPREPVMMFGVQNMEKGSFGTSWSGRQGRANHIEVQFYDESNGHKRNSAFWIDEEALARGEPLRQATINLLGCTNFTQAQKEAWLQGALNNGVQQSCSFRATYDAIGCQVGDVILVQHDMPKWGWADRVKSVNGNTIGLENLLTPISTDVIPPATPNVLLPAGDWRILVLKSAIKRGQGTIVSSSGSQFVVNATVAAKVRRVKVGAQDFRVVDQAVIGANTTYVLDRPVGSLNGQTAELWEVDALCEGSIANPYEWGNTLTLTSWTHPAIEAGDQIFIGRVDKFKKPFTITKFGHDSDHSRTINCIEYNEQVYTSTGTITTPNYSEIGDAPLHVLNLRVDQRTQNVTGAGPRYFATVAWDAPLNDLRGHAGAKVWFKLNGTDWTVLGTVPVGSAAAELEAKVGDVVQFKVVSFDRAGFDAKFISAPTGTVTIGRKNRAPDAPSNLTATGTIKAIALSWTNAIDVDTKTIEVWENTTSNRASAYFIQSALTNRFTRMGLSTNETRYYWIRAVSFADEPSAWVGPVSATTSYLLTDDIGDAIINTAKFAQDIEPVSIVSSLPTTKTTQYVTLDNGLERGKLFYWNGAQYVRVTQAIDITGQLTNEQIADLDAAKLSGTIPASAFSTTLRPPETVNTLPSTGNFQGRTVRLTSDWKLYVWTSAASTGTASWSKAIDGNDIMADSITANQIAAGAITASEIAAGAITANKLNVIPTNLNPDMFFEDASGWSTTNNRATGWFFEARASGTITETLDVPRSAVITSSAGGYTGLGDLICRSNRTILVTPGEQLAVRAKGWNGSSRFVWAGVNFLNASGNVIGNLYVDWGPGAGATWKGVQGVVPAGAQSCYWFAYLNSGPAAFSGSAAISQITITRPATAEMIVDGAITAAKISAGAITAGKIAAGAITTSNLSVGGNNVIYNSTLMRSAAGWVMGNPNVTASTPIVASAIAAGYSQWVPSAYGGGVLFVPTGAVPTGQACVADWRPGGAGVPGVPAEAGERWQARALLGTHRCQGQIQLLFLDGNGNVLAQHASAATSSPLGGAREADFANHVVLSGLAPASTVYAMLRILLYGNGNGNPFVFFTKTMLSKTYVNATEVQEWAPGGLTDISGNMIRTGTITADQIAANTITAQQIAADTITAAQISAGGIGASEIAAGAIKATHLAAEELIANTIQVRDLIIGTTKISNNAVTSYAFSDNVHNMGGDLAYRQVAAVGVGVNEVRSGLLTATIAMGYLATPRTFVGQIRVNGGVVAQVSSSISQPFVTFCAGIDVPPGTHVFEIVWAAEGGIVLTRASLIVFLRAK